MARPDYCPVGNEPCQSMCDEPCSWSGSKRRREDDALIQQLVEALEDFDDAGPPGEGWKSDRLLSLLASARARLEGTPCA